MIARRESRRWRSCGTCRFAVPAPQGVVTCEIDSVALPVAYTDIVVGRTLDMLANAHHKCPCWEKKDG